ncbi:CopD family protein [Azospirillum sp. HJ39]|uniref:CopD family protein n=1 Tax=Azospirillum sp. HJ39 TaxID=3159496 RepID=UPI003557CD17
MTYLWLKAFHIVSVMVWIGGMFAAAIAVAALSASKPLSDAPGRAGILDAVRRWDRLATSPAMALAWLFGVAVAMQGGWFGSPWLMMKLVFVVALSGLHGMLSGLLRKLDRAGRPSAMSGYAPPAIVAAVVVIVLLVVLKPY